MEYRQLGKTGMNVSVIGYGASPLGGVFGETPVAEGVRAVHCAVDNGINYFDVSPYYGLTVAEERLGHALEGKRDKIFLATKCGRYGKVPEGFDFSAERITAGIDESLKRLRTDHVDLLQAHDVEFCPNPDQLVNETIPAMRKIQESGKVRHIGITGLPLEPLRDIASRSDIDTILTYCHYNLMIDDLDDVLTPVCSDKGIGLINASPLHMAILTAKGPPDWHPAPQEIKDTGAAVVKLCAESGVDLAGIALRYCIDHPYVSTTLVGMSKLRHVQANLRVVDYQIDPEVLERIQKLIALVKNTTWIGN